MAPVQLKLVVSFSSQDDRYPVESLISGGGFKKWLSSPRSKTGTIEGVFQLESSAVITHLDVGSIWCANIEVQVGRSTWPQTVPFKTLIPTVNLMTPMESRNGNSVVRTRMFNTNDFVKEVCNEEFDRIRVLCRQPFRKDVQLGLSFIRVKGNPIGLSGEVRGSKGIKQRESTVTDCLIFPKSDITTSPSSPQVSIQKRENSGILKEKFANRYPSSSPSSELSNRLTKIAQSSDSGSPSVECLSRTAKLVIASANQRASSTLTTPPSDGLQPRLLSNSRHKRTAIPFELEVKKFLNRLQINQDDLSTMTLSDIRHRLERRKCQKLTKEEKKKFIEITEEFLHKKFKDVKQQEKCAPENELYFEEVSIDLCGDDDLPDICILDDLPDILDVKNDKAIFNPFMLETSKQESHKLTSNNLSMSSDSLEKSSGIGSPTSKQALFTPSKPLFKPGKSFENGSPNDFSNGLIRPSIEAKNVSPFPTVLMNTSGVRQSLPVTDENSLPLPFKKTSSAKKVSDDRLGKRPQSTEVTDGRAAGNKSGTRKRGRRKDPNDSDVKRDSIVSRALIQCTVCEKMVPQPNYLVHQARCKNIRKPVKPASSTKPQQPKSDWLTTRTEISIKHPLDTNMVECPVCQELYPSQTVNTHANVCLEMTLLV